MRLISRSLLRAIYEGSPDAIVVADAERRIVACNRAFEGALGFDRGEALGAEMGSIVAAGDVEARLAATSASEPPARMSFRRRDGKIVSASTFASEIKDDQGAVVGLIAVLRGLAEAAGAPLLNRRDGDEFLQIYEKTPAILQAANEDETLIAVSDRWCEWLGYAREEVVGRKSSDFVAESSREALRGFFPMLWRDGSCDRLPFRFIRKDGEVADAELSAAVVEFQDQKRALAVLQDVSRRNAAIARLETAEQAWRDFAFVAAHDLRSPLRYMMILADQLLDDRRLNDDTRDAVNRIVDQAEKMDTLIASLLNFAKTSHKELDRTEFKLSEAVADARQLLAGDARAATATIIVREDVAMLADRPLFVRVLQNLISNAVKHNEAETPTVELSGFVEKGAWRVEVADNGPGVDADLAEDLFEPFRRMAKGDGVGLGLTLCRRVIEGHCGQIWISADRASPLGGALVVMTLPRCDKAFQAIGVADPD